MKQIVDKLNKIAKAIDSDVTISNRKLIIDSLDSITKAFGGTPNDSKLIVDKLDDIANYVHGGGCNIPYCTVKIVNNSNEAIYMADLINPEFAVQFNVYDGEGHLDLETAENIVVPANSDITIKMLYTKLSDEYVMAAFYSIVILSEPVNIDLSESFPIVIDASQPSSFTVTYDGVM